MVGRMSVERPTRLTELRSQRMILHHEFPRPIGRPEAHFDKGGNRGGARGVCRLGEIVDAVDDRRGQLCADNMAAFPASGGL